MNPSENRTLVEDPKTATSIQVQIGDHPYELSLENRDIHKLRYDPINRRFGYLGTPITDQKEIERWLWENGDLGGLYEQVRSAKGLSVKPLVDHRGIVRDGNRRIAVLRRLSKETKAGDVPGFDADYWDIQQCMILPENMSERDVQIYLSYTHVTGVKTWGALNKASAVYDLHKVYGLTYDEIREKIGKFGRNTIVAMIAAVEATMEYGKKYAQVDSRWTQKYSYFEEAFKKPDMKVWIEDGNNMSRYQRWIAEKKIPTGMHVREFRKFFNVEQALEAFARTRPSKEDSDACIKAGLDVLSKIDPSLTSKVFGSVKETTELLDSMPHDEFVSVVREPAKQQMLVRLRDKIQTILDEVEALRPRGVNR